MGLEIQKTPVWRKIQRENFTRIDSLLDFLNFSPSLREEVLSRPKFPLNLPRRLALKMEKNQIEDPIFKQFVPTKKEMTSQEGYFEDPVQDFSFKKTEKLLQKYKKRALILTTSACAMHCRYCFRQNFPYETERKNFDPEIAYLSKDKTLNEVILSGGDPLSLGDEALGALLNQISQLPHIERLRFHTRFPIGIPERIDASFLNVLKIFSKQIIFVLHANHPKELDEEVIAALKKIQKLGTLTLNQSVLLKGVNDSKEVQLELSETLINSGILPYYLHMLDPVKGAAHFDVPKEKGLELIKFLEENTSGFAIPKFVQEIPGKQSKTRL